MSFLKNPWIYLLIIYLICVLLRGYQDFSSYVLPGINGGYYPVQVRSILETGNLAYPDMPLVFYLEAAFAFVLGLLSRSSLQENVLFTVRLFDTVLPPLLVFPVFFLAKNNINDKFSDIYALIIAALGGLHIFLLQGLSGDFTKNACVLAILGSLLAYLDTKKPRIIMIILFLFLAFLTHKVGIGLGFIIVAIHFLSRNKYMQKIPLKYVVLITIYMYVQIAFITNLTEESVFEFLFSGFKIISNENYLGLFFTWIILFIVGISLLKNYRIISREKFITIIGYLLVTACLSSIFLGKIYAERIWYISSLPLIGVVVFSFQYLSRPFKNITALLIVVFLVLSMRIFVRTYKLPLLKEAAYNEITNNLGASSNSIVVADHGIDWWTAWATHYKVAQPHILTDEQLKTYDNVYYINYRPQKDVYVWFGDSGAPADSEVIFKGEYIDIYKCNVHCYR